MGHQEILEALPTLGEAERSQLLKRLCDLQEADVLRGGGPTEQEKRILDHALEQFEKDGDVGMPWTQAIKQIKASSRP